MTIAAGIAVCRSDFQLLGCLCRRWPRYRIRDISGTLELATEEMIPAYIRITNGRAQREILARRAAELRPAQAGSSTAAAMTEKES
jgi:hypothetical protein